MKNKFTTTCILLSLILIVNSQVIAQITVAETFDFIPPSPPAAPTVWPNYNLPFGWTQQRITVFGDTSNVWKRMNNTATFPACTPYQGVGMMMYCSKTSLAGSQAALISKPYDFTGYTAPGATVKFWMYRDNTAPGLTDNIGVFINNAPIMTGAVALSGSANPVNRPCASAPVVSCTANGWYQYSYNIPYPGYTTNSTYIILIATSAAGANMYIDNFTIDTWPTQQTYLGSSLNHQETYDVNKGSQNNLIVGVKVTMNNAGTPYIVDSLIFTTFGTTLPTVPTDFANAKLFYTGNTNSFTMANAIQFGFTLPAPYSTTMIFRPPSANTTLITGTMVGSYTITVTSTMGITIGSVVTAAGIPPMTTVVSIAGNILTLSMPATSNVPSGTPCNFNFYFENKDNYLWLTYDIQPGATTGNFVDAEFISLKVNTTLFQSSPATLQGARPIGYGYCDGITPYYYIGTSWLNNSYTNNDYVRSVLLPGYAAVFPPGITNIYNTVWNATIPASSCTYPTCRFSTHPPDFEKFSPAIVGNTATLLNDSTYTFMVQSGTWGSGNYLAAWIDFNHDGIFNNTLWSAGGEKIAQSGSLVNLQWYITNFTVPINAYIGTTTLRVREVYLGANMDPCAPAMYGETEDYMITIATATAIAETQLTDFNLKISPNPNDGNFSVNYTLPLAVSDGALQVVDVLGNIVLSMPLPQGSTMQNINLEELPAGVYLAKISCGNSFKNTRFIKQ